MQQNKGQERRRGKKEVKTGAKKVGQRKRTKRKESKKDEKCKTSLLDLSPEYLIGLLLSFSLSFLIYQLLNYEKYFHN